MWKHHGSKYIDDILLQFQLGRSQKPSSLKSRWMGGETGTSTLYGTTWSPIHDSTSQREWDGIGGF